MISSSRTLTDLYAPVRQDVDRVERIFDDELFSEHPFVNQLSENVRVYRGKMLRPALVLLAADACGEVSDAHRTLAAVVEMVHLATLLHDDVLDQADMRRKRRTINAQHGNETAVLLGDYLISHAYHLCSSLQDQFAARTIASTTNTVCEGELIQVHHATDASLTEQQYLEIIRKKTAALTATCCALGARYAGADADVVRSLHQYGLAAGIAFQIVDDVLDVAGTEDRTGKSLGRDLALGKATLPFIHCLANAAPEVQTPLRELFAGRQSCDRATVDAWLESTGSIEYALTAARDHIRTAVDHLQVLPPSAARESLEAMAEFIVRRQF